MSVLALFVAALVFVLLGVFFLKFLLWVGVVVAIFAVIAFFVDGGFPTRRVRR